MLSGAPRFLKNAKWKGAGTKECKRTHRKPSGDNEVVGPQAVRNKGPGKPVNLDK